MKRPPPTRHRFLLVLLVVAVGLLAFIVAPLLGSLFAAAVFAAALQGLQSRLARAFGDRPRVAAATLTLGLTFSVLLPLAWLTAVVVRQVADGVDAVVAIVKEGGTEGLIAKLPSAVQPLARRLEDWLPAGAIPRHGQGPEPIGPERPASRPEGKPPATEEKTSSGDSIGPLLGGVARVAQGMLSGMFRLLVETGLFLVALYFMLVDGRALLRWIVANSPLLPAQSEKFLHEFHDVTVAVFFSTIITAALQAGIAAIGYLIVGIPQFPVALLATFVMAFIPAVGGGSVVVAIAVLLMLTGSTGWGIFLAAWGLIPVALADNVAKPLLAQGKLRLPGSVVFFAMLGGLAMFGALGVIAGPLIVSFFLVVVRALNSGDGAGTVPARPASE